jgi:hypothetical protein
MPATAEDASNNRDASKSSKAKHQLVGNQKNYDIVKQQEYSRVGSIIRDNSNIRNSTSAETATSGEASISREHAAERTLTGANTH